MYTARNNSSFYTTPAWSDFITLSYAGGGDVPVNVGSAVDPEVVAAWLRSSMAVTVGLISAGRCKGGLSSRVRLRQYRQMYNEQSVECSVYSHSFTQPPSGRRRLRICFADVLHVFSRPQQNYETTFLGNGWTDFHETFTKR